MARRVEIGCGLATHLKAEADFSLETHAAARWNKTVCCCHYVSTLSTAAAA